MGIYFNLTYVLERMHSPIIIPERKGLKHTVFHTDPLSATVKLTNNVNFFYLFSRESKLYNQ